MNERPTLIYAAGWMALPIGILWTASFFCSIYGTEHLFLGLLSLPIGIFSIYILYKQLTNFLEVFHPLSWFFIFRLSLVTSLFASLLMDAVQYAYLVFLDQGRMLSLMSQSIQSEEYRQLFQQAFPQVKLEEIQEMVQSMTVRDILSQFVFFNIVIALFVSLLAALPVRCSRPPMGDNNNKS